MPYTYTDGGMAFQVWASISLAIDITITSIMFWSVRDQYNDQPVPLTISLPS